MFPPFSLVGRVLAKIHRGKTNTVIVVPDWSTQYWYPQLFQMTNQPAVIKKFDVATQTFREPPAMQKTVANSNQGNNTTEKNLEAM